MNNFFKFTYFRKCIKTYFAFGNTAIHLTVDIPVNLSEHSPDFAVFALDLDSLSSVVQLGNWQFSLASNPV